MKSRWRYRKLRHPAMSFRTELPLIPCCKRLHALLASFPDSSYGSFEIRLCIQADCCTSFSDREWDEVEGKNFRPP